MEKESGLITEEKLAQVMSYVGVYTPVRHPFNTELTRDAVRHFVEGTGDTNPLFQDEDYAKKTKYGGIIVPPTFLHTMIGQMRQGLPGVHNLWAGAEIESFRPIKLYEQVSVTTGISAMEEKNSQFAGRMFRQEHLNTFRDRSGNVFATFRTWGMRTDRRVGKETGKYKDISLKHWTEEEIKAVEADIDREEIRGSKPRYWEDVQVGDRLTPVVKGPLTIADMIAWISGWGTRPFIRAHRMMLEFRRRHPGFAVISPQGMPDTPEAVHWDNDLARSIGAPGAYDFGPQRVAWLGNLLSNWMGDDGLLRRLTVEVRRFNLVGDVTWCKGTVSKKYVKDGQNLVDCDIWGENQRGEKTLIGDAAIILPSKTAI
ncbi:MaoC family dehydratase N-terminal domain-containing protein [Chloroflexota bacterium]